MNPILENLLWSWSGPYRQPLTFREIQTLTGMDSEPIATALQSRHVETVWTGRGLAYQPSVELLRLVAWQWCQPFVAVESDDVPVNVIPIKISA